MFFGHGNLSYDVKQKLMMLNKIFMFHYQLSQNTGCNMKFVINMNRQLKRLTNCCRSEQQFCLPWV